MSSLGNKREGTLLQERMRGSENGKSNRLQFSDHPSSRGGSEIFRVLLQNDKTLFLMSRRQLIYLALKMRPSPFSRFPPRLNFSPFFKMILIQMIPPSIFEVKIEWWWEKVSRRFSHEDLHPQRLSMRSWLQLPRDRSNSLLTHLKWQLFSAEGELWASKSGKWTGSCFQKQQKVWKVTENMGFSCFCLGWHEMGFLQN